MRHQVCPDFLYHDFEKVLRNIQLIYIEIYQKNEIIACLHEAKMKDKPTSTSAVYEA